MDMTKCPVCHALLEPAEAERGTCPQCGANLRDARPMNPVLQWLPYVLFWIGAGLLGWFAAAAARERITGWPAALLGLGSFALVLAWWIEVFVKRRRR